MNRLWLFGCSHGWNGQASGDHHRWYNDNSWGQLLADKLELQLHNRCVSGTNNFVIYRRAKETIETQLKPEDTVVIQWSYINRGHLIGPEGEEKSSILPQTPGRKARQYYRNFHDSLQNLANVVGYTHILRSYHENLYFDFVDGHRYLSSVDPTTWNTVANHPGYLRIFSDPIVHAHGYASVGDRGEQLVHPCFHYNDKGHSRLADLYHTALTT